MKFSGIYIQLTVANMKKMNLGLKSERIRIYFEVCFSYIEMKNDFGFRNK